MTAPYTVSIIIPHLKREDELKRLLDSLKLLNHPHEIITIKSSNPAKARNEGVARAKGEFIWFLDSDSEVRDPLVLTRMISILEHDNSLAGVGGEMVEIKGKLYSLVPYHFPNWLSFSRYFSKQFVAYPKCIATNNLLIRKKDFVGFSENLETMEDNDFCLRMKGIFLIRNDTCVLHHHSITERSEGKFAFYNNPADYINIVHQNRIKILYRNRKYLMPILPLFDVFFAPLTLLCQMFSKKSSHILLEGKSQNKIGWLRFLFLHIKGIVSAWKTAYELLAHPN